MRNVLDMDVDTLNVIRNLTNLFVVISIRKIRINYTHRYKIYICVNLMTQKDF